MNFLYILSCIYFFIPAHDKNKYKIIVKKNGVWKYLSLKGKLIKDNIPESTVKKDIEWNTTTKSD